MKFLRSLKEVVNAKKSFDAGKLTKTEIEKIKKESGSLIKFLIEYLQRKRGRDIERAKIRFKYGEKFGELTLLEKEAFIITDLDAETKEIQKAKVNSDGSLSEIEKSSIEEMEKTIAESELKRVFIKQPVFQNLKELFGKDVEILIGY